MLFQDAEEYFGHLLSLMEHSERRVGDRLPGVAASLSIALFRFGLEDRIQCSESGRVRPRGIGARLGSVVNTAFRLSQTARS